MDLEKFDDVLEDIRRVAEEKGFMLNHEIDALVGNDFSAEDIVVLYDQLSEEKIDYFDSAEKARLKMEAKKRREEKEEQKTEEDDQGGHPLRRPRPHVPARDGQGAPARPRRARSRSPSGSSRVRS